MSVERHYFPGNNTPKGFYSCYRHILGQREARQILCIKGGPGTGKSTFIRHVGEAFLNAGEDVDFLHCSADENSLDGILIHGKKTALLDGTSPHATDPMTPGAVDRIINLGDFWDEEKLREEKETIIKTGEKKSRWYGICYNYLAAASAVSRSLETIYQDAVSSEDLYRTAAEICGLLFKDKEISIILSTICGFNKNEVYKKSLSL